MGRYSIIKKEFSFLESEYGFQKQMKQRSGSYYFVVWTNARRNIMVLYDDQTNERLESPVYIRVYNADCFGTAYDDVEVYRKELQLPLGSSPRARIHYAAEWLKKAIQNKVVEIE